MRESPWRFVRQFHEVFGLLHPDRPALLPAEVGRHRQLLLEEEAAEVGEAVRGGERHEIAHELADVVYVAYGTAISYGIDLDEVLAEVHRANMSKLGPDGQPILRADGKVQKGPGFRPADVAAIVACQATAPR
jgi:predicted HAD superfamily Cof-like phosphohydrolase